MYKVYEKMEKNTKKFASAEQKLRLVRLVEADPQLKSGKFSSMFSKNEAKRRWLSIAEELNSITGAKKSWEEWRKTWQDRKANAKKKFVSLRRQANMTGGGPPAEPPTEEEMLIINCIDQQSLVGHTDSQESPAAFIDLSYPENSGEISLLKPTQDLTSYPGTSKDSDSRPEIEFSQLTEGCEILDRSPPKSNEDVSKTVTSQSIQPSNIPKPSGVRRRRTVAQRRLQEGLNAAQTLNKSLQEKNEMKKNFYEEFMKLMAVQTKALTDIASALNK